MKQLKNKFYSWFTSMNLRQKLLVSYLFLVMIPAVSIGFFSYRKSAVLMEEQAEKAYMEALRQAGINITYRLKEVENISEILYANKELQDILRRVKMGYRSKSQELDDYNTLKRIISNLERNQNVYRIRLFLYGNAIYCNEENNFFRASDLVRDNVVEKLLSTNTKFYWKYTYEHEFLYRDKRRVVSLVRVIRDLKNYKSILGIIFIDMDEKIINEVFEEIRVSNNGLVFVYDQNHLITYYSNRSSYSDKEIDEIIKKLNSVSRTTGPQIVKLQSEQYLVILQDIEYVGWSAVSLVPIIEISGKSRVIGNFTILLIILFSLFAIIIAILLSHTITKGIRVLAECMRQVGQGHYDNLIEVKGNDEIAWLQCQYNKMALEIKELIEKVYKITISKKETDLRVLEGQINPHFLYNTLDTLKWMAVRISAENIVFMVDALSRFFRLSLNRGQELISVEDEVKHVRTYMDIQNIRFSNRIKCHFNIDSRILSIKIIKLILQPIVENAIIHGIERKEDCSGTIIVEGGWTKGEIIFKIIDDGVGMGKEKLDKVLSVSGKGYGVKNVQQRIQLYYGIKYGLKYFSRPGIGTCVEIRLPNNYS